ncbi:MAG: hypothetical protein ACKV1O_29055 [Saprospiraceae bacterium]
MLKTKIPLPFLLITLLFIACNQKKQFNFYGKWQSLNDRGLVYEINKNGNYALYRDGASLYAQVEHFGQLKIKIREENQRWYSFKIADETSRKLESKGRIEIVNEDQIRIYFHKHHDILNMADEFHRTENLTSFEAIMSKIQQEPESQ